MLYDPRKISVKKISADQASSVLPDVRVASCDCKVELSTDSIYMEQAKSLSYSDDDTVYWRFVSDSAEDCITLALLHPDGDTLIGYATLGFIENRKQEAQGRVIFEVYVDMIFIDADYRGYGYGGTLAAASVLWLKQYVQEVHDLVDDPTKMEVCVFSDTDESPGGARLSGLIEEAVEGFALTICDDEEAKFVS